MVEITNKDCVGQEEVYCNWYKCSNCGTEDIRRSYDYCPKCGEKIEWNGVNK